MTVGPVGLDPVLLVSNDAPGPFQTEPVLANTTQVVTAGVTVLAPSTSGSQLMLTIYIEYRPKQLGCIPP